MRIIKILVKVVLAIWIVAMFVKFVRPSYYGSEWEEAARTQDMIRELSPSDQFGEITSESIALEPSDSMISKTAYSIFWSTIPDTNGGVRLRGAQMPVYLLRNSKASPVILTASPEGDLFVKEIFSDTIFILDKNGRIRRGGYGY